MTDATRDTPTAQERQALADLDNGKNGRYAAARASCLPLPAATAANSSQVQFLGLRRAEQAHAAPTEHPLMGVTAHALLLPLSSKAHAIRSRLALTCVHHKRSNKFKIIRSWFLDCRKGGVGDGSRSKSEQSPSRLYFLYCSLGGQSPAGRRLLARRRARRCGAGGHLRRSAAACRPRLH